VDRHTDDRIIAAPILPIITRDTIDVVERDSCDTGDRVERRKICPLAKRFCIKYLNNRTISCRPCSYCLRGRQLTVYSGMLGRDFLALSFLKTCALGLM